jgi:hypothetical protein
MSVEGFDPGLRLRVVGNLVIDRLTAKIAGAFAAEGIETLVLKGPVLAEWLYPGEVRPYGDSDLMVAPEDWARAVRLLERLGFLDYHGPMGHPRMESSAGTAFIRDDDNIDLHCALHGLGGDPTAIWASLRAGSEAQVIGGAELRVPGRAALLLHVGLHAAHHIEGRPIEDLRRAIALADEELWRQALELAEAYEGVPVLASGLRLLPEGVEVARRLEIHDRRSLRHDLRSQRVPMAEGLDELFSSRAGVRKSLALLTSELFPRPEFMRWWLPLARRGRLGLAAGYVWRPIWLVCHAPRGILTWWRVRRERSGG